MKRFFSKKLVRVQSDQACNYYFDFRKWSSNSSSSSSQGAVQPVVTNTIVTPAPESPTIDNSSQNAEVTDGEWTYDPNEPRYCLCNQVSYGDMVACDNEDVSIYILKHFYAFTDQYKYIYF